jgi:hypothetical protein
LIGPFAGHGATFGDIPYVVPADAEFPKRDDTPLLRSKPRVKALHAHGTIIELPVLSRSPK